MATRIQTIKLGHSRVGIQQAWHVLVVKNSTSFTPGDKLCKSEVDELCHNVRWDVTIVKYRPEVQG